MFLDAFQCRNCPGGLAQFDPVSIAAIADVGGGLISAVSGWLGGSQALDAAAGQIKAAKAESKRQAELQIKTLQMQAEQVKEMETQKSYQQAYDASQKARSQQLMALYAVGGAALLVSGFFVFKAMRK
jgi:hypothetical protein